MSYCALKAAGAPGECRYREDGKPDRAHWIPQQRIKQALDLTGDELEAALWDPRVWDYACRHHHNLYDNRLWMMKRDQYPAPLRTWAREHGFYYAGLGKGWIYAAGEDAA